jgi:hypothetical protein
MSENSLFQRIKKARIVQVLFVYLGASWAVLQVADLLQQGLDLPGWVIPVSVILLGEFYSHGGDRVFGTTEDVYRAFMAAVGLDPTFAPAYIHLMEDGHPGLTERCGEVRGARGIRQIPEAFGVRLAHARQAAPEVLAHHPGRHFVRAGGKDGERSQTHGRSPLVLRRVLLIGGVFRGVVQHVRPRDEHHGWDAVLHVRHVNA